MGEYILIIAGILVSAISSLYTYKFKMKSKQLETVLEHSKEFRDNTLMISIESISKIQGLCNEMFNKTNADRFLLLIAKNGKTEFRHCTVVYEQHKLSSKVYLSLGATSKYHGFEFDKSYLEMLKETEYKKYLPYKTVEMPKGVLKQIYEDEKVTESKLFFLQRKSINNEADEIIYCSIATHNQKGFNEHDDIKIRIFSQVLKSEILKEVNL